MYIHVCVYICVYIHVYIYVCIYMCIHICANMRGVNGHTGKAGDVIIDAAPMYVYINYTYVCIYKLHI